MVRFIWKKHEKKKQPRWNEGGTSVGVSSAPQRPPLHAFVNMQNINMLQFVVVFLVIHILFRQEIKCSFTERSQISRRALMQVVCPIFCGRGLCLAFEMSCESRRVISTSVGSFEWHATFDFESEAILAWLEKAAGFFGQLKLK